MNFAVFSGRLVRDPEIRYTSSIKAVASFCVAVDDGKTGSGEKRTSFIDCVAWEKRAEFIDQYFIKGDPIIVAGRMSTRTWEKDGVKHKATELTVTSVEFQRGKSRQDETEKPTPSGAFNELDDDGGELPF